MTSVTSEIIERAHQGNAAAVGQLYQMYHQSVFRYFYYNSGDLHSAEDLTAEVFLKVVQALPRFEPRKQGIQAWLFQIARNTAIDHARKQKSNQTVALEVDSRDPAASVGETAERKLTSRMLQTALRQLPDDQRDVIVMRFVICMPLAEVAAILHRSEDAIKGLQRRGLQALRELVNRQEDSYDR